MRKRPTYGTFLALVVGGSRGKSEAGSYSPAHRIITNGVSKDISAKCSFTAFNNGQIQLADGSYIDDNEMLEFVGWSSKTSEGAIAGNGFAEWLARHLAVGSTFSCIAERRTYMKTVKDDDGTVIQKKNGQPLKVKAEQWVIMPMSIPTELIRFSQEQIAAEVAEYIRRVSEGQHREAILDFDCRPSRFNSYDTTDAIGVAHTVAWKTLQDFRRTKLYTGGPKFGFMKVWLPDGATMLNVPAGASLTNDVSVPGGAGMMAPPGGSNLTLAKVGGKTYTECQALGWTDALMIAEMKKGADAKYDFNIFVQSGELVLNPISAPDSAPEAPAEPESMEMPV
jgi:hypothetical protein